MTMKQEAAARQQNAKSETASRTVALVVWTGSKLHTSMDIVVTYPVNMRKLLILFPKVNPDICHDVERHLASVSTGGKKASMSLCAFIQRKSTSTHKNKGPATIINLRSSAEPESELSTPLAQRTITQLLQYTPQFDTMITSPLAGHHVSRQNNKRHRSPSLNNPNIELSPPEDEPNKLSINGPSINNSNFKQPPPEDDPNGHLAQPSRPAKSLTPASINFLLSGGRQTTHVLPRLIVVRPNA
ncbi:uncharacterized protein MELLADRAFT_113401 [Melampsora larici-populina 98AG31]|uniref:Uncharacterized protein n=1 Tax=Melampsora larici-populina (strain 98AG31 / pathotype 3-4-7) TaxID=747676 RepID=F4S9R3_MELLP|nr:uncharacterized protein MELLADRAFT_113401 [Melampsora larici-populina 98AG31]EGF98620.1 hypothetical protein MELLADRAFT_113401 [Melampsora larici-populina 98AG31]